MLLLVASSALMAAIFAGGYMRHGATCENGYGGFTATTTLFMFALIVVPALANPNLAWVGVELVTLFAALLVAFESTAGALEAAWKFAILTIMGAPISLFGFFVLYWAFRSGGGGTAETWASLSAMASTMPPNLLKFAFLLVFVGFGTKAGLAPMHTWLPDAHSQAPTPVCAVLSGIKTTIPLYVILRFLSIILASPEARIGNWMVVIGLFSVGIAAFLLIQVRDYKRMFAFSTVEHMGIILVAAGFATHGVDYGAVAQMMNHSLTKSLCFYAAGIDSHDPRNPSDQRGAWTLPALAFCGRGAASVLAGYRRRSAVPDISQRILDSLRRSPVRTQRCRRDSRDSYRRCVCRDHAAGEQHVVWQARVQLPSRTDALKLPHGCAVGGAFRSSVLGVYIPAPVHSLLELAAQQLGGR